MSETLERQHPASQPEIWEGDEPRAAKLLEALGRAALLLGRDGVVLAANREALTLTGRDSLARARLADVLHGADGERVAANLVSAARDLDPGDEVIRSVVFACAGGGSRPLSVSVRRAGSVICCSLLPPANEGGVFEAFFDSPFEGLLIHRDGVIAVANQRAAELTGWTVDELRGKRVQDLVAESSLQALAESVTADRGRAAFTEPVAVRGVGKNGEHADIEVVSKLIEHEGRLAILSSFRDVTAYKNTERRLRDLVSWEDAVSCISATFVTEPVEQTDRNITAALARLLELEGADRVYLLRWDDAHVPTTTHAWPKGNAEAASASRLGGSPSWRGRLHEQSVIVLEASDGDDEHAALLTNSVAAVIAVAITIGDAVDGFIGIEYLGENRQLDREHRRLLRVVGDVIAGALEGQRQKRAIERANAELERKVEERTRELRNKHAQLLQSEKMAALGQLVAGVAHEINTPLGAIRSNHDVLLRMVGKLRNALGDGGAEPSKLTRVLTGVDKLGLINEEAIERIVKIVGSLRKFARLDEADLDTVDVHQGLESTLTLVHHELKRRITVVRDYGELPEIECYPNQLNQVFMNLLVNAAQAIEEKGEITISTRPPEVGSDERIVIRISDTGSGIDPEHRSRIFDPGFTTKGVGVGTGLGLAIVHQIVHEHGGEIGVDSEVGRGTTFTIRLPTKLPEKRSAPPCC